MMKTEIKIILHTYYHETTQKWIGEITVPHGPGKGHTMNRQYGETEEAAINASFASLPHIFMSNSWLARGLKELDAYEKENKPTCTFGFCPTCGAEGHSRERRMNGNDRCKKDQ